MHDQGNSRGEPVAFGGAAAYRITVQGKVPENWRDRLGGMQVSFVSGNEQADRRTVLVGLLKDQSELSGVLDALYNLHLPIIRVEQLEGQ